MPLRSNKIRPLIIMIVNICIEMFASLYYSLLFYRSLTLNNSWDFVQDTLVPRPPTLGRWWWSRSRDTPTPTFQASPRTRLLNILYSIPMDEGTLKTPIPYCRLYWSFLFGVVKQFCRFWIWSETESKTPAEYGPKYISTPPPPPPHSHTLSVYTVHLVWERGGGRRS